MSAEHAPDPFPAEMTLASAAYYVERAPAILRGLRARPNPDATTLGLIAVTEQNARKAAAILAAATRSAG